MSFQDLHIKDVRGIVKYCPNIKKWSAYNRKEHIIGIQLSGSALHKFENSHFVISENCIYFLNRKDDYTVNAFESTNAISVHFTTFEEIDINSFSIQIKNTGNIIQLLEKIEIAKRKSENLLVFSLLYKLLNEFQTIINKTYSTKDIRIIEAKNFIDTHFSESNCLSSAINLTKLTSRRFNQLFKKNFDTTPNQYIIYKKIEYSKELLLEKGLAISEIAKICGFSDTYYFSKVFKQKTGIPPIKWKNNK